MPFGGMWGNARSARVGLSTVRAEPPKSVALFSTGGASCSGVLWCSKRCSRFWKQLCGSKIKAIEKKEGEKFGKEGEKFGEEGEKFGKEGENLI
jgi:hypothetical protein